MAEPGTADHPPDTPKPARTATSARYPGPAGTAVLDRDGIVTAIDDAFRDWFGLPRATGLPFWSLLQERCPAWAHDIQRISRDTAPIATIELRAPAEQPAVRYTLETARTPNGERFVRLAASLSPDADPELPQSRAGAAARLTHSDAQIELLRDHWPGVIFSQDPDFAFRSVSGRIEELTGRTCAEWCADSAKIWDVIHESDLVDFRHHVDDAAATGQACAATFRVRNLRTGKVSHVREHRRPIIGPTGLLSGYVGVWLDVTRQTMAERMLSSAAWKETLAVLTMGLAHDFSNVMAGIHSLSESFANQVKPGHPFYEGLVLIQNSSMQASHLIHRIVNLHLGKPGQRNYHDLNQLMRDMFDLVRKVIPRRIEIDSECHSEALPVYVDAVEFRQVIINLALNAADAMPERGSLHLRTTRFRELPAGLVPHGATPRLPAACVIVEDSGCGIQPAHLGQIFDPFFTTKGGGKGSGLGLYNARLFAEKHNGAICVESQVGVGSRFFVCLPESDFSETETSVRAPDAKPAAVRKSLVLYGPASDMVGGTAETLRLEGFHVAVGQSLEQVADLLASPVSRYHGLLAMTDNMGPVLAAHVAGWRRTHPDLKLILWPIGRDAADLESGLLNVADLVITRDLSPAAALEKLHSTLKT